MNYKKKSIIFFAVILTLALCVFFTIYLYMGAGTKEVKAAKKFIGNIYEHNIVEETEERETLTFKSTVKNGANPSKNYYSVTTRDFGIDVDGDYNIVGFSNNVCKLGEIKVSKEEAKSISEKYLSYIYKGDYKFKDFVQEDKEKNMPYYSLMFTKYEYGYPYYQDQIVVSIDKTTGKLDGYSNGTSQSKPKKAHVNITKKEAEDIVINTFSKLYNNVSVIEDTYEALCDDKDMTVTQLCYVVTVKGYDSDNNEIKVKYFVETNKGKIINNIKDTVPKTVA